MLGKEAVDRRCSVKRLFLEISQNPLENACQIHFFNKVAGLRTEFCEIYNYTFFYKTPTVAAAFVGIKSDHLKSHTNTVNNTSLKAVYVSQNTKYK